MGKRKLLLSFLILIQLFLALSGTAFARSHGDYSIAKYSSYITIDSDGSVYFDEYITYKIHKDNAVIKKPVPMTNTSGMEGLEVYIQDQNGESSKNGNENNENSLTKLEQTEAKEKAPDVNVFYVNDEKPDTHIIEVPTSLKDKKTVTYCYRYTLKDQISIYNDTAVFFWQFITPNENIDTKEIEILISSPNADDTLDLMGFITGTIHGEKTNLEGGSLHIGVKGLKADEYLEVTVLMPTELVPYGRKVIDNYARESIIAELELWEGNAKKLRQLEQRNKVIGYILCAVGAAVIVSMILLLVVRKGLDKKKISNGNKNSVHQIVNPLVKALASIKAIGENILKSGKGLLIRSGKVPATVEEPIYEPAAYKIADEPAVQKKVKKQDYTLLQDITPAELCVLGTGRQNGDSLLVTVLQLVRRRILEIGYDDKLKGTLYLREDIDSSDLKPFEAYVITWLFKDVGSGNSIPLSELDVLINFIKMRKLDNKFNIFTGLIRKSLSEYDTKKLKKDASLLKQYLFRLSHSPDSIPLEKWEEYILYAIPLKTAGNILKEIIFSFPEKSFDDGTLTVLSRNNLPWLLEKVKDIKSKPLNIKNTFYVGK